MSQPKPAAQVRYQFTRVDSKSRPFPPRNSHMRAVNDGGAYVDSTAPMIAQEWLQWLDGVDDPDFAQREADYDYLELVYRYGCDEGEAVRLARRWLWDQIRIIET